MNCHVWHHHWRTTACAHAFSQHQNSNEIRLRPQIPLVHARHPQEVHVQSHAQWGITPNHFERACRCQLGEGPKRCSHPQQGMAHSVADLVSSLHSMMDGGDTNSEYTKSAYSATSTSESLEDERKPRGRNPNKDKQSKSCGKREKKKKKDDINAPAKNTCPH
jgi:hypothetical protein